MEEIKSKDGTNVYCKEKTGDILSYVDISKLCYVIEYFSELNEFFGGKYITFPLFSSLRYIEWRNIHIV